MKRNKIIHLIPSNSIGGVESAAKSRGRGGRRRHRPKRASRCWFLQQHAALESFAKKSFGLLAARIRINVVAVLQ